MKVKTDEAGKTTVEPTVQEKKTLANAKSIAGQISWHEDCGCDLRANAIHLAAAVQDVLAEFAARGGGVNNEND